MSSNRQEYAAAREAMNDYVDELRHDGALMTPKLRCDLIIKGGITSGIIYPWAIAELARTYRFKHLGGASAGAMAAAAGAAAELGRQHGAFVELAKLPAELGAEETPGGQAKMRRLFEPQPATRPLFEVIGHWVSEQGGGRAGALQGLVIGFAREFVIGAAIGLVAGVVLGLLLGVRFGTAAGVSSGVPASLLAFVIASAWLLYQRFDALLGEDIPKNCFGLCLGHATDGGEHVTDWLHATLQRLAQLDKSGRPLTFRQLWGVAEDEPDPLHAKWGENWVDLHIMTTNVTQGRPQELPFLSTGSFFFAESEMRKLFPDSVVDWMVERGSKVQGVRFAEAAANHRPKLTPMPAAADLPVVVAARMSFGFPLVLSAIPLWSVDPTSEKNDGSPQHPAKLASADAHFERNWFSDGGDCANMPVHMFDKPIPRWPAFGLNLREANHEFGDSPDEWTFLPDERQANASYSPWQVPLKGRGTFGWFLRGIFNTIQNWHDNQTMTQPGQRGRVAHIYHRPGEGGVALDMRLPKMWRLAERGKSAAKRLAERFAPKNGQPADGWTVQRWVRLRTAMAGQEEWLERFRISYTDRSEPASVSYDSIIGAVDCFPTEDRVQAQALCDSVLGLAKVWESGPCGPRAFRRGEAQPILRLHLKRPFVDWAGAPPVSDAAEATRAERAATSV